VGWQTENFGGRRKKQARGFLGLGKIRGEECVKGSRTLCSTRYCVLLATPGWLILCHDGK
jgi:hypothetical protein